MRLCVDIRGKVIVLQPIEPFIAVGHVENKRLIRIRHASTFRQGSNLFDDLILQRILFANQESPANRERIAPVDDLSFHLPATAKSRSSRRTSAQTSHIIDILTE